MYNIKKDDCDILNIYDHMIDKTKRFNQLHCKNYYCPNIIKNKKSIDYNFLPRISRVADIITALSDQGKLGMAVSKAK